MMNPREFFQSVMIGIRMSLFRSNLKKGRLIQITNATDDGEICYGTSDKAVVGFSGFPTTIPCSVCTVLSIGGKDRQTILINKAMQTLPDDQYQAVIKHEIGHLMLGHLYGQQNTKWYQLKGTTLEQEIEADSYAASIVGKKPMMRALVSVRAHIIEAGLASMVSALDTRIARLSNPRP